MLSKSAARAFFLVGTGLCTVAFIVLTIDTFRQIPAITNSSGITPAVVRGKVLWEENNCMGCHTLLGEGAYYAPELTKVHSRRGESFIRSMLRDPAAMYPGERQMVQYDFTEEEIDDLVAFFEWIDGMDLNGFPPTPTLAAAPAIGSATAPAADGRPRQFDQVCTACHSVGGRGGTVGPALDEVGDRYDEEYLGRWLRNPAAVKPGTTMPNLGLSDEQVTEMVAYLSTLSTQEHGQ
jgi:nitric oxide reductase subunit C